MRDCCVDSGCRNLTLQVSRRTSPALAKTRPRCHSADDMARIIASADEPLGTVCFVLSSTGMRIGEVLALKVEDVDYQRKLIHVRSSVYAGILGTPKSEASIASLPMLPALATRLKTYLASKHGHFFWTGKSRLHSAIGKWQRVDSNDYLKLRRSKKGMLIDFVTPSPWNFCWAELP